ncbi:DUF6602 domain-containing protein [Undibacterium sp.]|uniref:DUF6602 domain-containing protein n=1 Tax=Undibacterium sp. TaxID=1914977 RepID=UPI0025EB36B3|nr:DUF6602 domain-containing protein [Undibacterium sp.]
MKSRPSDLTGFAALLGESFSSRIELLTQVLQDAHYPSVGTYKERLLIESIRNYLPKSLSVGTGFVMFPHSDLAPRAGEHFDSLNKSAFCVSRQCDILIFDGDQYPPVFRDGDFVVLRPEAVKAVIEVKGTISIEETRKLVDSCIDFGRKWRATQMFYREHHQSLVDTPALLTMCWSVAKRKDGRPKTNPAKIRREISSIYRNELVESELDGFPLLSNLYIYGEAEISGVFGIEDGCHYGWMSTDGCFKRFDSSGSVYRDKDRTIAALLAQLHLTMGFGKFNRFFSYPDETTNDKLLPYEHHGIDWTWRSVKSSKGMSFNSRQLHSS